MWNKKYTVASSRAKFHKKVSEVTTVLQMIAVNKATSRSCFVNRRLKRNFGCHEVLDSKARCQDSLMAFKHKSLFYVCLHKYIKQYLT